MGMWPAVQQPLVAFFFSAIKASRMASMFSLELREIHFFYFLFHFIFLSVAHYTIAKVGHCCFY